MIGIPDERLGERICAAVVTTKNAPPMTVATLASYLLAQGLSKHYLPERVVALTELPTTRGRKIQKFKIREMLR